MLTVNDICSILKVSEETVRRWLRSNELSGKKIGNSYKIREEDLKDYLLKKGGPNSQLVRLMEGKGVELVQAYNEKLNLIEGEERLYTVDKEPKSILHDAPAAYHSKKTILNENTVQEINQQLIEIQLKIIDYERDIIEAKYKLLELSEKELHLKRQLWRN